MKKRFGISRRRSSCTPTLLRRTATGSPRYLRKENYTQAVQDFTAAIEIYPGDAKAYYGRARAYRSKRLVNLAAEDFRQACDLGEENACSESGR